MRSFIQPDEDLREPSDLRLRKESCKVCFAVPKHRKAWRCRVMRTKPALKLENSPLVLVLSQVRFEPVLKMSDQIADIQDAMRKEGLIRFSQEETQQITFGPKLTTSQQTRWIFGNREQTEAVVLTNDFFVYEVTEYDLFETFVDRLLALLQPVRTKAELPFASRIGLRYIDLILPGGGHSVDDFIAPSLRGLSAKDLGAKSVNYQFVIESQTEIGRFFIRSYESSGEHFLPPDLQTKHLKFSKSTSSDDQFRVLDLDHVSDQEIDFEGDALKKHFWRLHETTERGFVAATTADAIKYWKGELE